MIQIYKERYEASNRKNHRVLEQQLGRNLLYKGLKDMFGIVIDSKNILMIAQGEHGKPYLKDFPNIHYNISHTDGLAVCAIGNMQLGIDVERIRPFHKSILRKVLSDEERGNLEGLPEEEHSEYFFRLWTLKECYVKAVGCGITIPLTGISFEWKEDGITLSSIPEASFHQNILEGGYVLSICTLGNEDMKFA